jgi:hypothetical protein
MTALTKLKELIQASIEASEAFRPLNNRESAANPWATAKHRRDLARRALAEEMEKRGEALIRVAERAQEVVNAYDKMPDGPMGRGLTNGHFLRIKDSLTDLTKE